MTARRTGAGPSDTSTAAGGEGLHMTAHDIAASTRGFSSEAEESCT